MRIPRLRTRHDPVRRKRKRRPARQAGGAHDVSQYRRGDRTTLESAGARRRAGPNFAAVNAAALGRLPALCAHWLPDGRREGREWVALNPRRADRHAGSFKVNLQTGRWADFAPPDARGGDPVSLAAYLSGLSQSEAARKLAGMLGVPS